MLKSGASSVNSEKDDPKREKAKQAEERFYGKEKIDLNYTPINNGKWSGNRGNSMWKPDEAATPKKYNPQNKTYGEVLKEYEIEDGIEFKESEPNFDKVSKGNVKIEGYCDIRLKNYTKADEALAKQKKCDPMDVYKWRKANDYTWHEKKDSDMQKIPLIINGNIPHSGGVSAFKQALKVKGFR